jgi:tetratricopeptide (TPR) repeat protein
MRRLHLSVAAALALSIVSTASAQMALSGRASGSVLDSMGKPIKGAVVKASNPEAIPPDITSTTDERGRFGMIGLRSGVWTFTADAPGYTSSEGTIPVRAGGQPQALRFVLTRTPESLPNTLARDIDDQLNAAQAMRVEGRLDQALSAYQSIQSKNPKLTMLYLVIADLYRQKATREQDAATRQGLYDRAMASYSEVLKTDPGSSAAAEAAAQLQSMKK